MHRRHSTYYLAILIFFAIGNTSFAKSGGFVIQLTTGVGITGSSIANNTLLAIGLKKQKISNGLAFKYTYVEKNQGGFFDRNNVYKYRDRGVLLMRGFYRDKRIILVGAGLSQLKGDYHLQQKTVKTLSVPIEIHFIYAFSPVMGIGMNLYASLNGEHSYFGAGLNISFGKLK